MFKNTVAVLRWCGSFLLCIIIWYYCKFKTFFHHRKIWIQAIHFCLLCVRNTFSINTWFLFLFVWFCFCFYWAALNPFITEVWMSDNSPQRQFAPNPNPRKFTYDRFVRATRSTCIRIFPKTEANRLGRTVFGVSCPDTWGVPHQQVKSSGVRHLVKSISFSGACGSERVKTTLPMWVIIL